MRSDRSSLGRTPRVRILKRGRVPTAVRVDVWCVLTTAGFTRKTS